MKEKIVGQALGKMTKMLLAPVGPLQYFFDSPGVTHVYCLEQAYNTLDNDCNQDVATFFRPYHSYLRKGLFWADQGWKNVCHYYSQPGNEGSIRWPGAAAECQYYFNKAFSFFGKDVFKGMFYLGAALHLVQDMCVPHHSLGVVFDGHKEFEKWASHHWHEFPAGHGLYLPFTHPSQCVDYNAKISAKYYSLVSLEKGCQENSYVQAAEKLIPLTIATTAGFLNFSRNQMQGITLRLLS